MKKILPFLSLFLVSLFLLTFSLTPVKAADKKVIAVTIVPQIEMVEAVAGEKVEIIEMIPKGFSPSNYAPSPTEMRAFNQASIYFAIGVPADMQNILPRAETKENLKTVKLFKEIETEYSRGQDPHIWLSPSQTAAMIEVIRDQLIKIMPEYETEFKTNTKKYLEKLDSIDQKNKKTLAEYKGQEILAYHPSFAYFTEHYGLKMMAIEKDGKEPGPRHLKEIIDQAKSKNIKNVFYQAEIDSKKTKAVAESLGGEIIELDPLARNYLENLRVMAQKMAAVLQERADY